jgi:hypothetical protein
LGGLVRPNEDEDEDEDGRPVRLPVPQWQTVGLLGESELDEQGEGDVKVTSKVDVPLYGGATSHNSGAQRLSTLLRLTV